MCLIEGRNGFNRLEQTRNSTFYKTLQVFLNALFSIIEKPLEHSLLEIKSYNLQAFESIFDHLLEKKKEKPFILFSCCLTLSCVLLCHEPLPPLGEENMFSSSL